MPELSAIQYEIVYAFLSLTIATMGASAVFFLLGRSQVAPKYRPALLLSGIVVGIACYHYARIFFSWQEAYELVNGAYVASGVPFLDSYRYADWLLTVPLLVAELIAVLALPKGQSRSLIARLAFASVLMIATGYPGEVATDPMPKHIWGWVSTVPFAYILYTLWVELSRAIERQPAAVKSLVSNIRLLLLATWGVYPLAYLASALGIGGGAIAEVTLQVGYSVADITAKAGFGLMIYQIAVTKTAADREGLATAATTGELAPAE